jgi:hypothetical protein
MQIRALLTTMGMLLLAGCATRQPVGPPRVAAVTPWGQSTATPGPVEKPIATMVDTAKPSVVTPPALAHLRLLEAYTHDHLDTGTWISIYGQITGLSPVWEAPRPVVDIVGLEGSRPWVWTAIDPVSKLLLAIEVGPRTVEMAQRIVHQIGSVLASGCVSAWFSGGFKGYLPAILSHFGLRVHPECRQAPCPWPKPRWMPLPALLYAQVIKQYRRKRVVRVKHRVVFGTRGAIEQVLAVWG